jgi:four helix bundle protein
LIAWQKARELTQAIYKNRQTEPFRLDRGLRDQIRRAAVSVMSNIAEGYERSNPGDFHRFLSIAKTSCAELRSQLYVALDTNYLIQAEFTGLMTQAQEARRVIGGLRASVERQRNQTRS